MLRLLLFLTLVMTVLASLLMLVSTVIGRGTDTPVAVALSRPAATRGSINPTGEVIPVDLRRLLRADIPLPVADVRQFAFDYETPGRIYATTYTGDSKENLYTAGFYRYDYLTGDLLNIATVQSNESFVYSRGLFFNFFTVTSQQGQKITYVHPLDKHPYLFDILTGETTQLADLEIPLGSSPIDMSWSPDGSKIAIKQDNVLYVLNADGSPQFEKEFNTSDFYPAWLESEYLSISRFSATVASLPIDIISATDGSEHPLTENLEGRFNGWWECDGLWISYSVQGETQREAYLLNLDHGRTVRINDYHPLEEASINSFYPLPDCSKYVVTTILGSSSTSIIVSGREQPTYLFDLDAETVEYVDEAMSVRSIGNELLYEKPLPASDERQLLKRTIDPLSDPVVVMTYPELGSAYATWSTDMSVAIYAGVNSTSSLTGTLYMLNPHTGQTQAITSRDDYVESHALYNWRVLRGQ
jgi:hypothetical protein